MEPSSIYVKPTDKGLYTNFSSHLPLTYKIALIKTLLHRTYRICSDWKLFDAELSRIKQNLVNNNFPQYLLDKIIKTFINKKIVEEKAEDNRDSLTFFFRSQTIDRFNYENTRLKKIIQYHIKSKSNTKEIKLRCYYKPLKLSSMFSERFSGTKENVNHVVYQFNCNKDGCNASYIGYTTNSLKLRVSQHRYRPSKIFEHFKNEQGTPKPNLDISNFDILHRAGNFFELRLAESLLIKRHKPVINIKYNEMENFLNIF